MDDQERARILEEAWANIERAEAERDSLMAELEQRAANEPYHQRSAETPIYKTYERKEAAPELDAATQRRWDTWANALVQTKLTAFAEILGAEAGQMEKRLLTQFNAELTQLNEKLQQEQLEVKNLRVVIDELRAEVIDILRANNAKNVTPLRAAHG